MSPLFRTCCRTTEILLVLILVRSERQQKEVGRQPWQRINHSRRSDPWTDWDLGKGVLHPVRSAEDVSAPQRIVHGPRSRELVFYYGSLKLSFHLLLLTSQSKSQSTPAHIIIAHMLQKNGHISFFKTSQAHKSLLCVVNPVNMMYWPVFIYSVLMVGLSNPKSCIKLLLWLWRNMIFFSSS